MAVFGITTLLSGSRNETGRNLHIYQERSRRRGKKWWWYRYFAIIIFDQLGRLSLLLNWVVRCRSTSVHALVNGTLVFLAPLAPDGRKTWLFLKVRTGGWLSWFLPNVSRVRLVVCKGARATVSLLTKQTTPYHPTNHTTRVLDPERHCCRGRSNDGDRSGLWGLGTPADGLPGKDFRTNYEYWLKLGR